MDRYTATNEILALVDANPLNDVELHPIIEKYIRGLYLENQKQEVYIICNILEELKRDGEIEYNKQNFSFLMQTAQGHFISTSLLIRSTRKRQDKLEEKLVKMPSFQIIGNNQGSINTGTIQGNQGTFSLEVLTATSPNKPPINPQKNIIARIWHWLKTNPIITGTISGVVATIIASLILKHYHII